MVSLRLGRRQGDRRRRWRTGEGGLPSDQLDFQEIDNAQLQLLSSRRRCSWRRSALRPPTSWCGGTRATTPRKTRRSRRSSLPSSRRPASRSSSPSVRWRSCRMRSGRRSSRAGRPTSPSASGWMITLSSGRFEDRLVDLSDVIGHFSDLFDPDAAGVGDAAQRDDGQKALYGLPIGRRPCTHPCLEEPPGAGRFHPRRHPERVGSVLVVLVRRGAARSAPGHRPRRHLGRGASDVGRSR